MNWLASNTAVGGGPEYKDGNADRILNGGDSKKIQTQILRFVNDMRYNNLAPKSIKTHYNALRSFCIYNDILTINWEKIYKQTGYEENKTIDRPYTYDEIHKLLEFADYRQRVMILLMCSAGLRRGAIPDLRWRDLEPLDEHNIYRITVYRGSKAEYKTYCSVECTDAISVYLDYRKRHGEKIIEKSFLIRTQFNSRDINGAAIPEKEKEQEQEQELNKVKVSEKTIDSEMYSLVYKAGLRNTNSKARERSGQRYNLMMNHACRKFMKTQCSNSGMDELISELLLGHDVGLNQVYNKPPEERILEQYLKAIPHLTIDESERQKRKVAELTAAREKDQLC
jgi:integrase